MSNAPQQFEHAQARAVGAAFTFLTRLPFGGRPVYDSADLARSAIYFPLVGVVVACVGGAVYRAALILWSTPLALVLSLAATVLITGAFHEDALADALDGFGGGWSRAQVLAIMKDSRVGSYALVGIVLVLGAKVAALDDIARAAPSAPAAVLRALVAGHVLGRWSSAPLLWRYDYVRPDTAGERPSAGRPFAGGVTGAQATAATALALMLIIAAAGVDSILICVVATLVTAAAGRYCARRLGGITGDALGATNQLVELSVYLALAARR